MEARARGAADARTEHGSAQPRRVLDELRHLERGGGRVGRDAPADGRDHQGAEEVPVAGGVAARPAHSDEGTSRDGRARAGAGVDLQEEAEAGGEEGQRCYECGALGHFGYDCPKRKEREEREAKDKEKDSGKGEAKDKDGPSYIA